MIYKSIDSKIFAALQISWPFSTMGNFVYTPEISHSAASPTPI